jgi:uncharacterized protein (DUF111 family)
VLALLATAGAPTIPDDTELELVTPTGAALLAGLATFQRPAMRLERVGYGLGMRDPARPNALRAWLGETTAPHPEAQTPILLETNIDDQPAEQLAYTVERLFELGALDAWLTPIHMKKGRVGMLLAALVPAALEHQAVQLIMRETSTLGVRRRPAERHTCERKIIEVATPLGPIRAKRKRWQGQDLGIAPEYEDCARIARAHGLPIREVYQLVLSQTQGE